MNKNLLIGYVVSLIFTLGFTTISFAQTSPSPEVFPGVKIGNFGQMDERFYRGAQPEMDDYRALKDLGITTVVDLRNDPTDYEKAAVENLGMKYVNIPMSGWKTPKNEQIQQFMELANNPETGKFFVHCKVGIHRTGVVGAVYRFENYNWDYDRAYREMKNYDFSWRFVHGRLKSYVKDYAEKLEKEGKPAKVAYSNLSPNVRADKP